MIFVASLALIGIGLLCLFAKDTVWEWTQFRNDMKGVASERTDTWDTTTTIGGVVAVVVGIVGFLLGFR